MLTFHKPFAGKYSNQIATKNFLIGNSITLPFPVVGNQRDAIKENIHNQTT